MQENQSLPRGQYRAVLVNKSGESAERNFTFDAEVKFPFPLFEITEGRYSITSDWPVNRIVCYDANGNYILTVELSALSGTVSSIGLAANVRSAVLWAEDPDRSVSAFTNAVPIR
jgi:hypothetical protein